MSKECALCGKKLGIAKAAIKDGFICNACEMKIESQYAKNEGISNWKAANKFAWVLRKLSTYEAGQLYNTYMKEHPEKPKKSFMESLNDFNEETKQARIDARLKANESLTEVHEIRATCKSCGNVYHFDSSDLAINELNALSAGMNLGSLYGAMREDKIKNFEKCPKCGSRAVKFEEVVTQMD